MHLTKKVKLPSQYLTFKRMVSYYGNIGGETGRLTKSRWPSSFTEVASFKGTTVIEVNGSVLLENCSLFDCLPGFLLFQFSSFLIV
jgi:hypothetical protein